uniref:Helicase ATP-binding domain-containing protein n=1 Tax=Clastoptera arizonana TaxID=38151 RepID=A0A1B6CVG1_9HEMI
MLSSELPCGPPPVLPDVRIQLKEYIQCPERLPIHDFKKSQRFWPRSPNINSLFYCELSPPATTLKVSRDPNTGEILEFEEVDNFFEISKNMVNKTSSQSFDNNTKVNIHKTKNDIINFEKNFLTIPPGFMGGLEFADDGCTLLGDEIKSSPSKNKKKNFKENQHKLSDQDSQVISLKTLLYQDEDVLQLLEAPKQKVVALDEIKSQITPTVFEDPDEDVVLPKETPLPVLQISKTVTKKSFGKADWAEEIDVSLPVEDFEKKIPNPAFTWQFELDNFQKQAILKLEEHQNVIVAAHTSAGKTVIAEYAIAMSFKQHTRAIYTSPIKALSNQKYRDFKNVFEDQYKLGTVGLITGDVQLNQKAGCLIMTTEILRAMLYKKNEVIHDLEYVIFDEVHYINDKERGYVWEEVVILLPSHVNIVMLSATVPNTLEFANWVGRTKERKMYVISTPKRPIPLRHHLYTGLDDESKKDCFMIREAEGPFLIKGYSEAVASNKAIKERKSKIKGSRGGGRGGQTFRPGGKGIFVMTEKDRRKMFTTLISFLHEKEYLPTVLFTLSRNRCDKNAQMLLECVNYLTSPVEKIEIQKFFKKNISRLKGEDQNLPQVLFLEKLLMHGIGVHHSGILPILKEIVELLFHEQKVKILFATETFAMGVNMPARTVVFDSVVKFDGQGTRVLVPAEYIQMAGRAGRRGKDKTGEVIIMCKGDVPLDSTLKIMMFEKPMKLESQFRTTYSMILKNLKRSSEADLSVETMMTRSFKEFFEQTKHAKYRADLAKLSSEYEAEKAKHGVKKPGEEVLEQFYVYADRIIKNRSLFWKNIIKQPKIMRLLVPGQIILISQGIHMRKLGFIIRVEKTYFLTLVLHNQQDNGFDNREDHYYQMLELLNPQLRFVSDFREGYVMLKIFPEHIISITRHYFKKLDTITIFRDWDQKQNPRFRDAPVGPTMRDALRELSTLSALFDYIRDCINVREIINNTVEVYSILSELQSYERALASSGVHNIPNRCELFEDVYKLKRKEELLENLKYKLSTESMSLYPDFQKKLLVLKELKYIDCYNTVEMKGKIAIIMSSNELMVTELMFQNILKDLSPAEIAALLSSLVFQAKTNIEPKVDCLEEGKNMIIDVYKKIRTLERDFDVAQEDIEELNFGLIEVVYKWALGEKFAEIMKVTDVQEGIIVRCIQQLCELLRYVKEAANCLGDSTVGSKMDDAINAIKRDIVFAASLYTTDT